MTVGEYLKSLVFGLDLPDTVIERCAYSPREVGLQELDVEEDAYPDDDVDGSYQTRLDYAASTVYYSILGVFAGGGYSERVGDVSVSRNGYSVTQSDRSRFKDLADALRIKHGFDVEDDTTDGGIYDMGYTRFRG